MSRTLNLLIVDDDPKQVRLMETLMQELGLLHRCYHAMSGAQALAFLKRLTPFEDAPRPQLILLDLNMPGMNGYEVLREIKSDPLFRSIPVVMLSCSGALKDVDACYGEHANAYVQKPLDLEGNLQIVREIDRFWADVACILD